MTPQPMPAAQGVDVETRAGVAGVGLWLTGIRGREQTIQTLAVYTSYSAAVSAAAGYRALIGAGAYAVTYGGQACGNFAVLDVQATAEAIAGGLSAGVSVAATVRAQWRLIAV